MTQKYRTLNPSEAYQEWDEFLDGTNWIPVPEAAWGFVVGQTPCRRPIVDMVARGMQHINELRAENERLKVEVERYQNGAPAKCPLTGYPFFMWIDHPELGMVPTYGGPFDSYTIPERNATEGDQQFTRHRYDHDRGGWVEPEGVPVVVMSDQDLYKIEDERDTYLQHLRNLLAGIHGDGGHYLHEHGMEKAVADAVEKLTELRQELEEEQGRWQEAIADEIQKQCGERVDGSGCDSGDPLDLSITEIGLGFIKLKDKHEEQLSTLQRDRDSLKAVIAETTETETAARNAARPILGEWVDGDSHSVPTVADIATALVDQLSAVQRERDEAVKRAEGLSLYVMHKPNCASAYFQPHVLASEKTRVPYPCDCGLDKISEAGSTKGRAFSESLQTVQPPPGDQGAIPETGNKVILADHGASGVNSSSGVESGPAPETIDDLRDRLEKAEKEAGERLQKMQQLEQQWAAEVLKTGSYYKLGILAVPIRPASIRVGVSQRILSQAQETSRVNNELLKALEIAQSQLAAKDEALRVAIKALDALDELLGGVVHDDWADFHGAEWNIMADAKAKAEAALKGEK